MTDKSQTTLAFLPPDHPDFLLDDYPLYNLNRTSWTYMDEMGKVLKAVDVDAPTWRVLTLLGDRNPSTVTELSQRTVTKMSTITRILIRMEKDKLVERKSSPTDSRVTEVFITDKGRMVLEKLKVIAGRMYRTAFEGFSDSEINTMVQLLRRLRENLTRSPYLE